MKTYPKGKFEELSLERQTRVLLDTLYAAENAWESPIEKEKTLEQFKEYFQWMNFYEIKSPMLHRLASYHHYLDGEISLRKLLDLAVPLERFLELSIKDDLLVPVREGDRLDPSREVLPLFFVLDHLRSAFNVGSLFRTAECLGVQHIFLVGYTPTPEDAGVVKTAMGTDKHVSWSFHNHIAEVVDELNARNIPLVALETTEGAKDLIHWEAPKEVALMVGNERFGLSQNSLGCAKESIEVTMLGRKNSLNVANAMAIASFEVVRQWKK